MKILHLEYYLQYGKQTIFTKLTLSSLEALLSTLNSGGGPI